MGLWTDSFMPEVLNFASFQLSARPSLTKHNSDIFLTGKAALVEHHPRESPSQSFSNHPSVGRVGSPQFFAKRLGLRVDKVQEQNTAVLNQTLFELERIKELQCKSGEFKMQSLIPDSQEHLPHVFYLCQWSLTPNTMFHPPVLIGGLRLLEGHIHRMHRFRVVHLPHETALAICSNSPNGASTTSTSSCFPGTGRNSTSRWRKHSAVEMATKDGVEGPTIQHF